MKIREADHIFQPFNLNLTLKKLTLMMTSL